MSSKKRDKKGRKSSSSEKALKSRTSLTDQKLSNDNLQAQAPHASNSSRIRRWYETTDTLPESSINQSQADSEDSINPFKKYMSQKNESMLSAEIQAILKKPITMPKLPNYYTRRSLQKLKDKFAHSIVTLKCIDIA